MLDAILKSKFYTKCKAEIKMTKKRIEIIKRKRNAMQRFLRNDVADLLRTALESNAYGRVEQLYLDQKLSSCYEFVDQSCLLVLSNLSAMNKQRECPDECKESISTLMFAAARFADLPELRELRSLFVERYGDYLEPYVNQEFVKNLKADPPSKDVKLEMMQEIATECGIKWNSNALGQKLFKPSPVVKETNPYANVTNKESLKPHHQNASERNIQETEKKNYNKQTEVAKNDHTVKHALPYKSREEVVKKDEKNQIPTVGNRLPYKPRVEVERKKEEKYGHGRVSPYWSSNSSSSSETITSPDDSASEDIPVERKFHAFKSNAPPYVKTESTKKSTSSDTTSVSGRKEDVVGLKYKEENLQSDKTEERKLYGLRSMGPPYIKPEMTKKPTNLEDDIAKPVPRSVRIRRPLKPVEKASPKFSNFEEEEDEKKMDKLLSHYSRKPTQSPSDASTQNHAPKRSGSLPLESMATPEGRKELSRAASYQPDSGLGAGGHVHPKLPDYDDFVARLAAFRASS